MPGFGRIASPRVRAAPAIAHPSRTPRARARASGAGGASRRVHPLCARAEGQARVRRVHPARPRHVRPQPQGRYPLGRGAAWRGALLLCDGDLDAHVRARYAGIQAGSAGGRFPPPSPLTGLRKFAHHGSLTSQSLRGCVAYCLAKEICHLPFQTVAPLLAAVAAKLVLRLHLHLTTAFVALALLMWCASGVGYVVSIALDKVRRLCVTLLSAMCRVHVPHLSSQVKASVAGSVVLMLWITANGISPSNEQWHEWGPLTVVPSLSPQNWSVPPTSLPHTRMHARARSTCHCRGRRYIELMYTSTARQYASRWDIALGMAGKQTAPWPRCSARADARFPRPAQRTATAKTTTGWLCGASSPLGWACGCLRVRCCLLSALHGRGHGPDARAKGGVVAFAAAAAARRVRGPCGGGNRCNT